MHPPRFTIRGLMVAAGVAAVWAGVARGGPFAFEGALTILAAIWLGIISRSRLAWMYPDDKRFAALVRSIGACLIMGMIAGGVALIRPATRKSAASRNGLGA